MESIWIVKILSLASANTGGVSVEMPMKLLHEKACAPGLLTTVGGLMSTGTTSTETTAGVALFEQPVVWSVITKLNVFVPTADNALVVRVNKFVPLLEPLMLAAGVHTVV